MFKLSLRTLSNGVYGSLCRLMKDIVQVVHFGPQLPPASVPAMVKWKKRSIDTVDDANLSIYNTGNRRGPPSRRSVELTSAQIMEDAWKKNLLWLLTLLHSSENQTIPSWTGFNILVRSKHVVAKDSEGYLPTLNGPATDMSTVYQVLKKSLQNKETLRIQSIVVVFDQALYAKPTEIKWKHSGYCFENGSFSYHLYVLGGDRKAFPERWFARCMHGIWSGVLKGRSYNRAIWFHKIMFEALNRLAWNGFQLWIEEHHKAKKPHVNELMKGLKQLIDSTCEPKFKFVMKSHLFQEVSHLFLSYSHHLRHSNGKFWMSYVDMIEVLLGLIRATRERN